MRTATLGGNVQNLFRGPSPSESPGPPAFRLPEGLQYRSEAHIQHPGISVWHTASEDR